MALPNIPGVSNNSWQIVDRKSATTHFNDEVLGPLNATHQDLCKYRDRFDPNYMRIRNAIKELMRLTMPSKPGNLLQLVSRSDNNFRNAPSPRCSWLLSLPSPD